MLAHSGLHLEADLVEQRNERQNGGRLLYLHAQLVDANEHIGHKEAGRHERAPHDRPQRKGQCQKPQHQRPRRVPCVAHLPQQSPALTCQLKGLTWASIWIVMRSTLLRPSMRAPGQRAPSTIRRACNAFSSHLALSTFWALSLYGIPTKQPLLQELKRIKANLVTRQLSNFACMQFCLSKGPQELYRNGSLEESVCA